MSSSTSSSIPRFECSGDLRFDDDTIEAAQAEVSAGGCDLKDIDAKLPSPPQPTPRGVTDTGESPSDSTVVEKQPDPEQVIERQDTLKAPGSNMDKPDLRAKLPSGNDKKNC